LDFDSSSNANTIKTTPGIPDITVV